MSDNDFSDEQAAGSGISDPASLWPLVNALTKVLTDDCHEQTATVVSGATRELAMTRAHLDFDRTPEVPTQKQADELRISIEALMKQARTDFDRLESQLTRQQDEIAALAAQLALPVTANSGATKRAEVPQAHADPSAAPAIDYQPGSVAPTHERRADATSSIPPGRSGGPVATPVPGPPDDSARSQTPRAPDHPARWRANVLVGAITLAVIVLVLAFMGAL